ncbi:unnamed protein product [Adineta ricciae]|uniref:Archaemetzincin-2 n=1 Tax=Adineta ricciae TaxID=249248 RepID=A0A814ITP9_ADIRI|nr:unnamed protein product [Adineta ricciae]CAF1651388.1 unnamed protein product [Adineta ricciae]
MACQQSGFQPPTLELRVEALGETDNLNEDIRLALTVAIEDSFPVIPKPSGSDWLSVQHEDGQTVQQFQRTPKTRPTTRCHVISIQPIGDFSSPRSPDLDIVCEFSRLFFPGCATELLPSVEFDNKIKKRIDPFSNQPQYLVAGIIAHLKKLQRKRHNRQELFSIGVTMSDIYPRPDWNFVYGSASIDDGIGIYSFARLDPLFPYSLSNSAQRPCTEPERVLILKRAVSTYVHEVMHLFGLEHCIYYSCLMNGCNCESEMDRQLLYLCPICLKKMYLSFGKERFRIKEMYQGLLELCRKVEFQEEVHWYENRLRLLNFNT